MSYDALIYSHSPSPRLQYIVDFLSQYYGLQFKIIFDEEKYRQSEDKCKINYSYHRLSSDEIFIHPHGLLFETFVRPVKIEYFEKNNYKAFFKTEEDFGFDLLAAIFYLISRYEEYLPHQKDSYGRYAHENSIAFKEKFLHLPLINIWLEDFKKLLSQKNSQFSPDSNLDHSQFSFLPTYDIDMAWSFRNKGFKRNAGALLGLFLKAKFKKIAHRIKVMKRKTPDPFDAYEWMDQLHRQYSLEPVYFFLVAKQKSKYDKNINVANPEFQLLIKSIADKNRIGLHPSWRSGDALSLIEKEKLLLEEITGQKINSSRQHFIKFNLPETYQQLISNGIINDYSMGYGSINGFRASIASSFYWYDLKNEKPTKLMVHPFCFMDANAYYEQQLSAEAALEELIEYCVVIKSVNGTMITIWHNSFLGTGNEFEGWKETYQQFIEFGNRQSSIVNGCCFIERKFDY